jgi:uncharacterized protein (DUF4415 family)
MSKFDKRRPLTDAEEAEIQAMIASDPDNPELTSEQIANERPFAEVFPALAESIKRSRGRPKVDDPKEAITLRLPSATIERFKAAGQGNWRSLMAEALEKAVLP